MSKIFAYRDIAYIFFILFVLFYANSIKDKKSTTKYVIRESKHKVDSISKIVYSLKEIAKKDSIKNVKNILEINVAKQEKALLNNQISKLYEKMRKNDSLPLATDSTLYKFFAEFDTKNND